MEQKQQIADLIEGCRRNDRRAQRIVFEMYKDSMMALCRRYAKSSSESEDDFREGVLRGFRFIASYSGMCAFCSWIRKIFVNTCVSIYWEEYKHNSVEKMENLPEENYEMETPQRFSSEQLYEALDSLSQRQRAIFNLVVIDGCSYAEAAKELGISVDVLKTLLYRARQRLKIYLTQMEEKKGERV